MPEYLVTSAAGRQIGSERNMGVGTVMQLSEGFADAFVAMGWLVPRKADQAEPEEDGGADQAADAGDGEGIGADPKNTGEEGPQAASRGGRTRKPAKATSGPENGA